MISENGCPLEPGSSLNQTIKLRPMAQELLVSFSSFYYVHISKILKYFVVKGSSSRGLALDSWVTKNETDLTLGKFQRS